MREIYPGSFEDREVAVARKLSGEFMKQNAWIKGYGFDDLVQECLVQWYLARHTYQGCKGSSRQTYMAKIVKSRLQNILNEQFAERRAGDRLVTSLDELLEETASTPGDIIPASDKSTESVVSLHLDIEIAVSKLVPV